MISHPCITSHQSSFQVPSGVMISHPCITSHQSSFPVPSGVMISRPCITSHQSSFPVPSGGMISHPCITSHQSSFPVPSGVMISRPCITSHQSSPSSAIPRVLCDFFHTSTNFIIYIIILFKSVCLLLFAVYRPQFLLDRLRRCLVKYHLMVNDRHRFICYR